MHTALFWVEVLGLLAFAISGYLEAERRRMDPVGHFTIAFVCAFGGGTLRDVLLDRRPLFWVEHQGWVIVIFGLALALPWLTRSRLVSGVERLIPWPDALGMGLFAASGTAIALEQGMPAFVAAIMGVITATFGGVIRDVLCNEVPQIFLRTELHATCAFAGAWVYIGSAYAGFEHVLSLGVGALTAFVLRVLAMRRGWRLM